MQFINSKLIKLIFILILIAGIFSCKKAPTIIVGAITGPKTVCYGELGVVYSIENNSDADFILWTVPEQAEVVSGQGTNIVKVNFGRNAGNICVKYFNKGEEISVDACLEVNFDVQDKWCRLLDFKGGVRFSAVGFSIGNKGYIGTGISDIALIYKDFWEFDPILNTWTQKANFGGEARTAAVGFSIGNKGYIGTGYKGGGTLETDYCNDFWEFDPILNTWTRKADCSDTTRQYAFGFSIGNKGYIGSGQSGLTNAGLHDFYEYDQATDQWLRKSDVVPRISGVSFSIDNKGYMGGGLGKNDFYEYQPTTNLWTQKNSIPPLTGGRSGAVGFSIGNKGYIGTGYNANVSLNDFYEYDPGTNTWSSLPQFDGEIRDQAIGFSIGNKGYIGIGVKQSAISFPLSDFWVFTQ